MLRRCSEGGGEIKKKNLDSGSTWTISQARPAKQSGTNDGVVTRVHGLVEFGSIWFSAAAVKSKIQIESGVTGSLNLARSLRPEGATSSSEQEHGREEFPSEGAGRRTISPVVVSTRMIQLVERHCEEKKTNCSFFF